MIFGTIYTYQGRTPPDAKSTLLRKRSLTLSPHKIPSRALDVIRAIVARDHRPGVDVQYSGISIIACTFRELRAIGGLPKCE
jgi:hypothetical protein